MRVPSRQVRTAPTPGRALTRSWFPDPTNRSTTMADTWALCELPPSTAAVMKRSASLSISSPSAAGHGLTCNAPSRMARFRGPAQTDVTPWCDGHA